MGPQLVEGQQLYTLHMGQGVHIGPQSLQVGPAVGEAGDHHVADPHGGTRPAHCFYKVQGGGHVPAGDCLVARRLMVLHIIEHQVGVGQDLPINSPSGSRGVQTGMDTLRLQPPEARQQKVRLGQRLAAGEGHAPAGAVKVTAEAQQPADQRAVLHRPAAPALGVGVVTVAAPQGAALEKDHCAHPWTVHQPHALHGVDISRHPVSSLLFCDGGAKKGAKKPPLRAPSAPRRSAW